LPISITCTDGVAASQLVFPDCVADISHIPDAMKVTVPLESEHTLFNPAVIEIVGASSEVVDAVGMYVVPTVDEEGSPDVNDTDCAPFVI
jgi:hypothetical protein